MFSHISLIIQNLSVFQCYMVPEMGDLLLWIMLVEVYIEYISALIDIFENSWNRLWLFNVMLKLIKICFNINENKNI